MDNRIEIGNKLNLEKIEERISVSETKKQIFISQVLDETEDGKLMISMPIQEGNVVPFSVGQKLNATFFTKSGLLRCQVVVTGRYKKGSLFMMEVSLKNELNKVQRREYFRFDCRMPMFYRIISDEEKKLIDLGKNYEVEGMEPEWKSAAILDLSGGGICFISNFREEKDTFLQVKFDMQLDGNVETMYAFASILRCERNENNTLLYDSHVKFWRLDQKEREKIIRYIFEEQRRKRSKEMGMN